MKFGDNYSFASGVNGDGSVVVGSGFNSHFNNDKAFRWTAVGGMVGLGFLSGDHYSTATGVNSDGSVVVGESYYDSRSSAQAFRWTAAGGMVGLGILSADTYSGAKGVNGAGSVVVGHSVGSSSHAFRWTAAYGMQSIQDLLTAAGVSTTGWALESATAVSENGETIIGSGTDPSGHTQAWIARLPLPPATLAVWPNMPLNLHGSVGGPFASDMSGYFTLSNTGTASLNYSIAPPSWLSVSPSSSGSLAGGASVGVVVSPGPLAIGASAGNYSSSITFTNTTNGNGNTSVVTNLLVSQHPGGSLDSNDNGRSDPSPDQVAGINRPPLGLPSGQ